MRGGFSPESAITRCSVDNSSQGLTDEALAIFATELLDKTIGWFVAGKPRQPSRDGGTPGESWPNTVTQIPL